MTSATYTSLQMRSWRRAKAWIVTDHVHAFVLEANLDDTVAHDNLSSIRRLATELCGPFRQSRA